MTPDRAANSALVRRMPSCTVASWGISCMKPEDKDFYKTSVKNGGSVPNPTDKKGVITTLDEAFGPEERHRKVIGIKVSPSL